MFHRCLVHLLILLTAATLAVASPDGDVLLAFKNALQDPENALQSWDSSLVDPCTYFHVTCDGDNRVIRLDLGYYNLSGNLIPALGKLDRLQYLELYFNNLSGTIPEELGGLKSLRSLDLYNNNLSGSIPDSLSNLSNLAFLRINDNKLTGCIPVGVTKLPNLSVIDVSNNNIFGTCT